MICQDSSLEESDGEGKCVHKPLHASQLQPAAMQLASVFSECEVDDSIMAHSGVIGWGNDDMLGAGAQGGSGHAQICLDALRNRSLSSISFSSSCSSNVSKQLVLARTGSDGSDNSKQRATTKLMRAVSSVKTRKSSRVEGGVAGIRNGEASMHSGNAALTSGVVVSRIKRLSIPSSTDSEMNGALVTPRTPTPNGGHRGDLQNRVATAAALASSSISFLNSEASKPFEGIGLSAAVAPPSEAFVANSSSAPSSEEKLRLDNKCAAVFQRPAVSLIAATPPHSTAPNTGSGDVGTSLGSSFLKDDESTPAPAGTQVTSSSSASVCWHSPQDDFSSNAGNLALQSMHENAVRSARGAQGGNALAPCADVSALPSHATRSTAFIATEDVQDWEEHFNSMDLIDLCPLSRVYYGHIEGGFVLEEASSRRESMIKVLSVYQRAAKLNSGRHSSFIQHRLVQLAQEMRETQRRLCEARLTCPSSLFLDPFFTSVEADEDNDRLRDAMHPRVTDVSASHMVCRGITALHIDSSHRLIAELDIEPCSVSVSDVIAFQNAVLSPRDLVALLRGVLGNLSLLHAAGFVHGALHGGNILLSLADGHCTLTQPAGLMSNTVYPTDLSVLTPAKAMLLAPLVRRVFNFEALPLPERLRRSPAVDIEEEIALLVLELEGAGVFATGDDAVSALSVSSAFSYTPQPADDLYALGTLALLALFGIPVFFGATLREAVEALAALHHGEGTDHSTHRCSPLEGYPASAAAKVAAMHTLCERLFLPCLTLSSYASLRCHHAGYNEAFLSDLMEFVYDCLAPSFGVRGSAELYGSGEALLRHPFFSKYPLSRPEKVPQMGGDEVSTEAELQYSVEDLLHFIAYPIYSTLCLNKSMCGTRPYVARMHRNAIFASRWDALRRSMADLQLPDREDSGGERTGLAVSAPVEMDAVGALWPSLEGKKALQWAPLAGEGWKLSGMGGAVAASPGAGAGQFYLSFAPSSWRLEPWLLCADHGKGVSPWEPAEEVQRPGKDRLEPWADCQVLPRLRTAIFAGKRNTRLGLLLSPIGRIVDVLVLRDLRGCRVEILEPLRFVVIANVAQCEVVLGPCFACYMSDVRECGTVAVACTYLMLQHVTAVSLYCTGVLFLSKGEDCAGVEGVCEDVQIKPYSLAYPGLFEDFSLVGLVQEHEASLRSFAEDAFGSASSFNMEDGPTLLPRTLNLLSTERQTHDVFYSHALPAFGKHFTHSDDGESDVYFFFNEMRGKDLYLTNVHGGCKAAAPHFDPSGAANWKQTVNTIRGADNSACEAGILGGGSLRAIRVSSEPSSLKAYHGMQRRASCAIALHQNDYTGTCFASHQDPTAESGFFGNVHNGEGVDSATPRAADSPQGTMGKASAPAEGVALKGKPLLPLAPQPRCPVFFVLDIVEDVSIRNCSQCTVFVVGATGTVLIEDCHDMRVFILARECNINDCAGIELYALVTEYLGLINCHDVTIAPLFLECPYVDTILYSVVQESKEHELVLEAHRQCNLSMLNVVFQCYGRAVCLSGCGAVEVRDSMWYKVHTNESCIILSVPVSLQQPLTAGTESYSFVDAGREGELCSLASSCNFFNECYAMASNMGDTMAFSLVSFEMMLYCAEASNADAQLSPLHTLVPIVRLHDLVNPSLLRLPGSLHMRPLSPAIGADASKHPNGGYDCPPKAHEVALSPRGNQCTGVACDLILQRITMGEIHLMEAVGHLCILNCSGPLNIVVCAAQHIVMEDCRNVTLRATCASFAAQDCHHCHLALHVNTPPHYLRCSHMLTSTLNIAAPGMEKLMRRAGVQATINQFNQPLIRPETDQHVTDAPYITEGEERGGGANTVSLQRDTSLASLKFSSGAEANTKAEDQVLSYSASSTPTEAAAVCRILQTFLDLRRPVTVVSPLVGLFVGVEETPLLGPFEARVKDEVQLRLPFKVVLMNALALIAQCDLSLLGSAEETILKHTGYTADADAAVGFGAQPKRPLPAAGQGTATALAPDARTEVSDDTDGARRQSPLARRSFLSPPTPSPGRQASERALEATDDACGDTSQEGFLSFQTTEAAPPLSSPLQTNLHGGAAPTVCPEAQAALSSFEESFHPLPEGSSDAGKRIETVPLSSLSKGLYEPALADTSSRTSTAEAPCQGLLQLTHYTPCKDAAAVPLPPPQALGTDAATERNGAPSERASFCCGHDHQQVEGECRFPVGVARESVDADADAVARKEDVEERGNGAGALGACIPIDHGVRKEIEQVRREYLVWKQKDGADGSKLAARVAAAIQKISAL